METEEYSISSPSALGEALKKYVVEGVCDNLGTSTVFLTEDSVPKVLKNLVTNIYEEDDHFIVTITYVPKDINNRWDTKSKRMYKHDIHELAQDIATWVALVSGD